MIQCVRALCLFSRNFCFTWWVLQGLRVLRGMKRKKKKSLHSHYSILTSGLISAQGHQYFWHFRGGINIEWMSLCCARGAACLRASTKITWICLLACSAGWRNWRRSLRSLSAFNIMHHKQYPIWTAELWKYTARPWEGDDKKSTSCMSNGLG